MSDEPKTDPAEQPEEDAFMAESDDAEGEEGLLGEVEVEDDAEQEEAAEQFDFTPSPRSSHPRPVVKREDPNQSLKAVAIPLLITIGALLLVPAVWAVLILCGAHVWRWENPNAKAMALVMLMCWPIAGILIAAAVFFYKQIQRQKAAMQPPIDITEPPATNKPK